MKFWAMVFCVCTLLGCGGGGGSTGSINPAPTASTAQGLWSGTTPGGTKVALALLDNGATWGFYTLNGVLVGAFEATLNANGNVLTGTGRDFNLITGIITPGPFSASVVPNTSVTITSVTGEVFTGTYNASYDQAASLSSLSGVFAGVGVTGSTAPQVTALDIRASGAVTVVGVGCNASGTVKPRASGKNIFDLSISFSGSSCALGAGTVATGIAYYNALTHQVLMMALNALNTDGFIYLGTKL